MEDGIEKKIIFGLPLTRTLHCTAWHIIMFLGCAISADIKEDPVLKLFSSRQSSGSCQAVVRQLSDSCQQVVRQLSGSCQAVVRQSSDSH